MIFSKKPESLTAIFARGRSSAFAWLCMGALPGDRGPAGPGPQAAGHVRRNRSLRHRCHRRRHRCRLGKRALKFRDWGKMAATFVDLKPTGPSASLPANLPRPARELHPEIENKNLQQMAAYREMSDEDLFDEQWVRVTLDAREFPGYKGERVACAQCGEGINYDRFLVRDGQTLCLSCAAPEERTTSRSSLSPAPAASTAWATRRTVASSKCLPRICAPIGSPSDDSPQGTEMPQIPARLAVTV